MFLLLEKLFVVQPNLASVIFGSSYDGVALVVESTTENFVLVSFDKK